MTRILSRDPAVADARRNAVAFFRADRTTASLTLRCLGAWVVYTRDAESRDGVLYLGAFDTLHETTRALAELEVE